MTTTNTSILPNSTIDINRRGPPDLIEVPPEVLSKIEDVEETTNSKIPKFLKKPWRWIRIYAKKFRGLHEERPKRLPWHEYIWSFIGALFGIAAVAFLHYRLVEK